MNKKLLQVIKGGREDIFYNSRTWRKKRLDIIKRDNNECQLCKEDGKVTVGTDDDPLVVHHIKELKDYPELGLTNDNLISLCFSCHNKIHERFGEQESKADKLGIPERW